MNNPPYSYAIIGNGRLARHLCHYFSLLRLPYTQWYRQLPLAQLQPIIDAASHIIVAISDCAIDSFIANMQLTNQLVIHCSGATSSKLAFAAHPLQTFSYELYELEKYQQIPFIVDAEGPEMQILLPGLPNPCYKLPQTQKNHYHALCVMANNFTTLLWQKVFSDFQHHFSINESALYPLLEQTVTNLKNDHLNALTGPLVRGDQLTLQHDLDALARDPYYELFKTFIDTYQTTQCNHTETV